MQQKPKQKPEKSKSPVVREYDIQGIKYVVTATIKDGAKEDAAAKIRRLIKNEILSTTEN